MIPSMSRKITITTTFCHRFQHIIRQNVCLFTSFQFIYNIIMFEGPSNKRYTVIFLKISSVIFFSKTAFKVKNMWKIQNQRHIANFSDRNLWKHFGSMNKCSLNEYESFENVFSSINHKERKISNSKIILRIKKLYRTFPSEHHFRP